MAKFKKEQIALPIFVIWKNLIKSLMSLNKFSRTLTQEITNPAAKAMLYGIGLTSEDMNKAQIGIASTGYEGNPCNMHLNGLSVHVKKGIQENGMVGLIFHTIGVSDGMTNGNDGMSYSLPSRDIIADSIENVVGAQCPIETYSSSTLYHAQDLPFALKDIPDVFTNFRKRLEKEVNIRAAFETPKVIHSPEIPPLQLPTLADLNLEPIKPDKRAAYNLKGGETAALKRLQHYLYGTLALSTYKDTRNGLIGDAYSTKFSAHLSLGCVSARSIYYAVKKYELQHGANESTYWLIFELMWRDYFRFMMKKYRQKFFLQNGIQTTKDNLQNHDAVLFAKWQNAATGNAFIDANIRELNSTGFMSNRGRQNVASYLHNDLKLDWRYGAAYFEQQLIDYDVCSNWGNWAYLAGVGNDPRGQRTFNTEKQALDYDKDGAYRKLWSK